jgi:predicted outer membrane repeat protein
MTSGRFEGNTAMAGGAVSIRTGCQATFTGTVFSGNSVTGDDGTADGNGEGGGAIYEGYGKLILVDVEMIGNTASVYGGAISAVGGTVTATGGEFKNNTAVRGGAINLVDNCNASFTNTKFTANSATGKANNEGGGAINAEKGSLILSGVTMDGNTSAYYGGAINARKGTVEIKDSVITNSKGSTGAALYFRENETKVIITNSTVSNNTAKANGVIYMTQAGTLTVDGLTVSGNKADKGGVFYLSGGVLTFNGVVASDNTATTSGNLMYITGASTSATVNCTAEEKAIWESNTYNSGATVNYVIAD